MNALRLIGAFMRASLQQETAYRANFWINLLYSLLNLGVGVLGLVVLFSRVEAVGGWDFPSTLALLGVYLVVGALRGLFLGPSFEALAGMDGEVWSGRFDFTLLRPVNTQFWASFRQWRFFALVDLGLGLGVLLVAVTRQGSSLTPGNVLAFLVALTAGVGVVYAVLLAFTALVFWSPGFLFTWVFDALFQMARYPVAIYPAWLRIVLTWLIPVGIITTIPAEALTGRASPAALAASLVAAVVLVIAASALFQRGLRRYASASS
jgi:ABC-2 type transport system permease protein